MNILVGLLSIKCHKYGHLKFCICWWEQWKKIAMVGNVTVCVVFFWGGAHIRFPPNNLRGRHCKYPPVFR